jgi:hypothetical protein
MNNETVVAFGAMADVAESHEFRNNQGQKRKGYEIAQMLSSRLLFHPSDGRFH